MLLYYHLGESPEADFTSVGHLTIFPNVLHTSVFLLVMLGLSLITSTGYCSPALQAGGGLLWQSTREPWSFTVAISYDKAGGLSIGT